MRREAGRGQPHTAALIRRGVTVRSALQLDVPQRGAVRRELEEQLAGCVVEAAGAAGDGRDIRFRVPRRGVPCVVIWPRP